MCQQWLSVAGLVLDVIGFLIIAFEWRHTYLHSVFLRETQVDRTKADEQGRNYEDSTQAAASMWRHTQRENLKDNRYRARLFFNWCGFGDFRISRTNFRKLAVWNSLLWLWELLRCGGLMLLPCAPSAKHNKSNAAKIAQGMPKHPNPAKAIAEVKQTHVERQALRNFTMPLAVGKA